MDTTPKEVWGEPGRPQSVLLTDSCLYFAFRNAPRGMMETRNDSHVRIHSTAIEVMPVGRPERRK